jgi:ABC-type Na+ transport system ATPase subunit NatA
MYKVSFVNPETGKGYIDGYRTAKRAREVVRNVNALFEKEGCKGIRAEYMGRASRLASRS